MLLTQSFPTAQVRSPPTGVFPAFADTASAVECRRAVELLIHELVGHFNAHASGLGEIEVDEPAGGEIQEWKDEEHVVVADTIDNERKHKGDDEVNEEQHPVGQRIGAGADIVGRDFIQEEVADGSQAKLISDSCK